MKTIKGIILVIVLAVTAFSCKPPVNATVDATVSIPLSNTLWYGEFESYGYDVNFVSDSIITIKTTTLSTMSSTNSNGTYLYSDETLTGRISSVEGEIVFSVSKDYKKISMYGPEGILELNKK